jgi:putative transposase
MREPAAPPFSPHSEATTASVAAGEVAGEMAASLPACLGGSLTGVLALFLRWLPADFFARLCAQETLRQNNRIYTHAVVLWLMVSQRLLSAGSMQTAVLDLLANLPRDFWPRPCKRLREELDGKGDPHLSAHTTSYNNARQALPVKIVEQCLDRVWTQLLGKTEGAAPPRPAFFVDGSSMRMPRSEALRERYPPASNQHGESHWPLLRIVVAHDLYSGLAMRPVWGPMHGPEAVSEQSLLEQGIDRLPPDAVVMGDANFGVFSVAYASDRRKHPVLLRLTLARAGHLADSELVDGMDRAVAWKPSRDDRRAHPELPAEACVHGRLVVRQVHPDKGPPFLLALFTTLKDEADRIVEWYGYRWNIETDLRSLKSTLQLDQLTCTDPDMVTKEIYAAILAYNLVRAVTWLAAQQTGLKPRQFSFKRVRDTVYAFAPQIAAAADPQQAQRQFARMMHYVRQATLPRRNRKRPSYPRAVWPKSTKYATRKE